MAITIYCKCVHANKIHVLSIVYIYKADDAERLWALDISLSDWCINGVSYWCCSVSPE